MLFHFGHLTEIYGKTKISAHREHQSHCWRFRWQKVFLRICKQPLPVRASPGEHSRTDWSQSLSNFRDYLRQRQKFCHDHPPLLEQAKRRKHNSRSRNPQRSQQLDRIHHGKWTRKRRPVERRIVLTYPGRPVLECKAGRVAMRFADIHSTGPAFLSERSWRHSPTATRTNPQTIQISSSFFLTPPAYCNCHL